MCWLIILSLAVCAHAVTLRVPTQYSTIQAGLNATADGDTVLVDLGVYEEALFGPGHSVCVKGNVEADTGNYPRPVIDPSNLPNSNSRHSFVVGSIGTCILEDLVFRNGPEMFPRSEPNLSGGVVNFSPNLVVRNCMFDSVYIGLKSDMRATLDGCDFIDGVYACVVMPSASLRAFDCSFDGVSGGWGMIEAGPHSIMERCSITDRGIGQTVYWHHADSSIIRDCVIRELPIMTASPIVVHGRNCLMERCVVRDCQIGAPLLSIRGSCAAPATLRDCLFYGNYGPASWPHSSLLCVTMSKNEQSSGCNQNVVEGCIFRDGQSERGSIAISLRWSSTVANNRFVRLSGEMYGVCTFDDESSAMHNNYFEDCGLGVTTDFRFPVDAEFNWWGDGTGPYHPLLNPLGQGVSVGDSVDFEPWHLDTTFLAAPEPRPPLPEQASLLAYPNPFNSVTTIQLTLLRAGIARIELFDITGRRVKELWSGAVGETRDIQFNASEFASGIYFVRAWDPLGNRLYAATKIVLLK